ncbi:tetratricopeptide repeat protein [Sphaerimonospora thailandensis]|uniref:tetratricopeptide repeat protein n=1 Tax=Sphaerimonospora thailandensis TaxID=795644 RepID=UPI001EF3C6C3|nr:tetratricopeptide repeat protein [Sphaerimonospora thailandensis]
MTSQLLLPPIDAHRRRCGPYTAAGALLHALVPGALERRPDLVAAHDIEIRTAAPDLCDMVPARRQSIAAGLPRPQRILVPAPRRTLRIANGLAEFLRDYLRDQAGSDGPRALVVEQVDQADHTDRELLTVLLRRLDPALLTLVVCAADPDPELAAALRQYAEPREPRVRAAGPDGDVRFVGDAGRLGDYVELDGTCDAPEVREPYERMQPGERARRHRERADALASTGLVAPRLGAIPYHREHGGDLRATIDAFAFAVEKCLVEGFHHAVAELGERALRIIEREADPAAWWRILHSTASALGATEREDAARALFDLARREIVDAKDRATAAYATAMLLVRHHDPARRDADEALAWINEAVALTSLLPDRRVRAFHLGFDLNGKALVVSRRGRLTEAYRLVEEAIELAERDLDPGEHPIHRLVLRANRAQLTAMLGRPDEALPDLTAAIEADPRYPDYYIDRGNLLCRLGRHDDAVADYETAMRVSPPFPEPYYNRAEIRFAAGDHEGALADLDYALELDPGFAVAYVNRAGLLAGAGEYGRARDDAERGLALDPGNAHLLCVLGQVATAEGRHAEARKALDAAVDRDPGLASAWAARGVLAFETDDPEGAVADLTRAVELGEEDAGQLFTALFNRAVALRALGRQEQARADLLRALELAPDDEDVRRALAAGS